MAISDVGTRFYHSASGSNGTFVELASVFGVPATGVAPEKIDVTTLDLHRKSYIEGREDSPDMEFDYYYGETLFGQILALKGTSRYFLIQYQDGSGVKIKGKITTWIEPVQANQAVQSKFSITPEEITYLGASGVTACLSTVYTITFNVTASAVAVAGAIVQFNGELKLTDAGGLAVFSNVTAGAKTYVVAKATYDTATASHTVSANATVNVALTLDA